MSPKLLTHKAEPTAVQADPTINPADEEASASGLVDLIVQIGRERQRIVESLRDSLLNGDDAEALERARELTGLPTNRSIVTSLSTQAGN
jgi:hypothetical protein